MHMCTCAHTCPHTYLHTYKHIHACVYMCAERERADLCKFSSDLHTCIPWREAKYVEVLALNKKSNLCRSIHSTYNESIWVGPDSCEPYSHKKRCWGTGKNTQRGSEVRSHRITRREVSHMKAESEVRIAPSQCEECSGHQKPGRLNVPMGLQNC